MHVCCTTIAITYTICTVPSAHSTSFSGYGNSGCRPVIARQIAFSWRLISCGVSFAFIIGFSLG